MDGYSVTEAASILGVPTERVWELLARGILSGTPEGEAGMRVFLQPRPAPTPPVLEPRPPNGDGGSREPERELSPFRELLTEFRNLTERYGQALLALGESRGEVASLRSRVDLLEQRMDLRLPMSPTPPAAVTAGWPTPVAAVAPAAEPTAESQSEDVHSEGEEHPRRRRGHRRATESFAEALARAEDPTRPELPGAAETAAAMAALRDDAAHDVEAVLPRELPAAEPMPMPDEPRDARVEPSAAEAVAGEVPEPELAEAQAGELEAVETAEMESEGLEPELETAEAVGIAAPEAQATEPEPIEAEPGPAAAEAIDPAPPEADVVAPEPHAAESYDPAPPEADVVAPAIGDGEETLVSESIAAEPAPPAAESTAEPEAEPEPITFDPERYTVEIIEPDWYADEETSGLSADAPRAESADAMPTTPTVEPEPEVEHAADDSAPEEARSAEAPAAASDASDEETMLWFGREAQPHGPQPPGPQPPGPPQESEPSPEIDAGADEIEVVGAAAPRREPATLPGSRELDDALEALDAVTRPPSDPSEGIADDEWPPASAAEAPTSMSGTAISSADWGAASGAPPAPGPGLLPSVRPPTTPASRAYRRLRRIFPG